MDDPFKKTLPKPIRLSKSNALYKTKNASLPTEIRIFYFPNGNPMDITVVLALFTNN